MLRRDFLLTSAAASVGLALPRTLRGATLPPLFTHLGVAAPIEQAGVAAEAGAAYLNASVGGFLCPDKPEEAFASNLEKLRASPIPVWACNGFIRDPKMRCIGPDATHPAILEWSKVTFERAARAGVKVIVFGSGGARRLPDGFPVEKANDQFAALLTAMGPQAEASGVTVAVELLQARECNYLTRISEVSSMIARVAHPRIRALADLYHMANMGDTPADLAAAMPQVSIVEIAEKDTRTAPGVSGDDFRPYFRTLARAGYSGLCTIEGKWDAPQLKAAFLEIRRQEADVAAESA